jgi:hypothetical protein
MKKNCAAWTLGCLSSGRMTARSSSETAIHYGGLGRFELLAWLRSVARLANVDGAVLVDDIGRLHETLHLLSRTFEKSRHGGTTTNLELTAPRRAVGEVNPAVEASGRA